jgi:hypothetical protein
VGCYTVPVVPTPSATAQFSSTFSPSSFVTGIQGLLPNINSGGLTAGVSAAAGIPNGSVGGQFNVTTFAASGSSTGTAQFSGGGFVNLNTPQVGLPPNQTTTANLAIGAFGGAGAGVYVSNATSNNDMLGAFTSTGIATPWFSVQMDTGTNNSGQSIWSASFTVGPSLGAGFYQYQTYTFPPFVVH